MVSKKPSEAEEEYFARAEAEKKRQRALEATQALGEQERQRLKELHYMRCPKCGMTLSSLAMSGVQVARCFGCHGIFLDEADIKALVRQEDFLTRTLNFFARKSYTKDTIA